MGRHRGCLHVRLPVRCITHHNARVYFLFAIIFVKVAKVQQWHIINTYVQSIPNTIITIQGSLLSETKVDQVVLHRLDEATSVARVCVMSIGVRDVVTISLNAGLWQWQRSRLNPEVLEQDVVVRRTGRHALEILQCMQSKVHSLTTMPSWSKGG